MLRALHNSAQVAVLAGLRFAVPMGLALDPGARIAGGAAAAKRSGRFMRQSLVVADESREAIRKGRACGCLCRSHRENDSASAKGEATPRIATNHHEPLPFNGQNDERQP